MYLISNKLLKRPPNFVKKYYFVAELLLLNIDNEIYLLYQ